MKHLLIAFILLLIPIITQAEIVTYTYDDAGRLKTVLYGEDIPATRSIIYYYDEVGNHISEVVNTPTISVSPETYDFGTIDAGTTSSPVTFTLTNDGNRALTFDTTSLSGTNSNEFSVQANTCIGYLSTNHSCTIEVVFSPVTYGTKTATLIINSAINPLEISLSGIATELFELTVNKAGTGSGTITSTPAGIDCGADCTESILNDTVITLTAVPDTDSQFIGWSGGGCTTGDCVITMTADTTVTATFDINPADFTATPLNGAAPLTVTFTDNSTGSITSWLWDFGDSTTSTEQNPVHTYDTDGTYTVSLTVSDGVTSDTMTKTDYISVQSCALPVRIDGTTPVYYSSLQAAYDAAVNGDVIQVQAVELIEDLNAQFAISVTLDGGYNCDYTSKIGETVLRGNIHTSNGTVTARDIHLAQ